MQSIIPKQKSILNYKNVASNFQFYMKQILRKLTAQVYAYSG